MDDEEKIYTMKLLLGVACGLLSVVVIPQDLVNQGIPVGWYRLLWLLGTWLLLPFPLVLLGLRVGFLGMSEKEKVKQDAYEQRGQEVPEFSMKSALKKIGGPKFILKTGVGAFFFLFMLTSTVIFTILFP
nr:hypothetical protein [Candidatus Sigynarchaeota archaeon]